MTDGRRSRRIEEQMRRASSKATEHIARRFGGRFPMWIGCGFPKSGTVWLCHLMSAYLGVPFPQNYALPIAMRSVVHAHWDFDPRLPPTAYIHRDGRDVMVSLYFHQVRAMNEPRHPRSARQLNDRFRFIFGSAFDSADVEGNMARFIEAEFERPMYLGRTWTAHVHNWLSRPHTNVFPIGYEELAQDASHAFTALMTRIEDDVADSRRIALAIERNDFALVSGRRAGLADPSAALRKGIIGDWRNVFNREAGDVFAEYAGRELSLLGYETDNTWLETLSS